MSLDESSQGMPAFLADCMLGRLARWLRILGYDTWYFRAIADSDLLELHKLSGRILLTRDTRLIRDSKAGKSLFLSGNRWEEQLLEVTERLRIPVLEERILTRCPVCNHLLRTARSEDVRGRVPEFVFDTHGAFRDCRICRRVYWGGTHRARIFRVIESLAGSLAESTEGSGPTEEQGPSGGPQEAP